jgi:hypothetical protein
LNFYAFSNDDLQELEKLINILKTKVVKLYITQQVVDEFYRNRDSKLAASFDTFRPFGNASCPSFMTSVPEYQAYKKALIRYKNARKALMEKTRAQADSRELLADQLFARIAKEAQVIPVDDKAYAAAEKRARLGNPPGKIGPTIGDELNWELLLAKVPNGSDLHVITKDSDYASKLNPTQAKVFLTDEWKKAKQGDLYIHEQISLFFSANYPDEDFSLEIEKKSSIEALIGSGNFASTHAAVASLEPYIPFLTPEEAEEVLQGALSNSQVVWIASDPDVEAFLNKVLQEHGGAISETLRKRVEDVLGLNPEDLNPDEVAAGEQDAPINLE